MKLCKMIEIYLKYDNMHTIRTINAFICINNHVNLCINSILSSFLKEAKKFSTACRRSDKKIRLVLSLDLHTSNVFPLHR